MMTDLKRSINLLNPGSIFLNRVEAGVGSIITPAILSGVIDPTADPGLSDGGINA